MGSGLVVGRNSMRLRDVLSNKDKIRRVAYVAVMLSGRHPIVNQILIYVLG
jgi:hypothetical protein